MRGELERILNKTDIDPIALIGNSWLANYVYYSQNLGIKKHFYWKCISLALNIYVKILLDIVSHEFKNKHSGRLGRYLVYS